MLRSTVSFGLFEWDLVKELENKRKHGVDFTAAAETFLDPDRIVARDEKHSSAEERLFYIGKSRSQILTVRYTRRGDQIRIIGAGCWRKEAKLYENKTKKR